MINHIKALVVSLTSIFFLPYQIYSQDLEKYTNQLDSIENLATKETDQEKKLDLYIQTIYYAVFMDDKHLHNAINHCTEIIDEINDPLKKSKYLRILGGAILNDKSSFDRLKPQAESILTKSYAIAKENEYKIEQFKSALQYIRFLRTETKLDEALSFLQKEEQILKEIPDSDSLSYSCAMNKFLIYEEKHHIVSAYRELILAGEIADRLQNKEKQQRVEEKLKNLFLKLEQYEKARQIILKNQNEYKKSGNVSKQIDCIIDLAKIYLHEKNYDLAAKKLDDAKYLSDSISQSNSQIDIKVLSVQLLYEQKKYKEALELFTKDSSFLTLLKLTKQDKYVDIIKIHVDFLNGEKESALSQYRKLIKEIPQEANLIHYKESLMETTSLLGLNNESIAIANDLIQHYEKYNEYEKLKSLHQFLDTTYYKANDFKNAYLAKEKYGFYDKKLKDLSKENELYALEIEAANKKMEKEKIEAAEKIIKRNNIQYTGISLAIFTLFVILLLFGAFKVSETMIRTLGFFTFIFFFEFIILIADHWIHDITHGEPWKIMAFKIVLISILMPFHHWIEHKVISFLTSHNLILRSDIFTKFFRKTEKLSTS